VVAAARVQQRPPREASEKWVSRCNGTATRARQHGQRCVRPHSLFDEDVPVSGFSVTYKGEAQVMSPDAETDAVATLRSVRTSPGPMRGQRPCVYEGEAQFSPGAGVAVAVAVGAAARFSLVMQDGTRPGKTSP
jgi:hypothetical protein